MKKSSTFAAAVAGAALSLLVVVPAYATPSVNSLPNGDLSFKLYGETTETNTWGNNAFTAGYENTWGVGTITTIQQGINALWTTSDSGQYLNYMLYGVSDISTQVNGSNINVDSAGATLGPAGPDGYIHLDLYLDTSPLNSTNAGLGPAGRTGYGSYTGITNGTLWLSLILVPGCDASNPSATLCQTLNSEQAPANGSGSFYAVATGGTAFGEFQNISGQFNVASYATAAFSIPGSCNYSGQNQQSCFEELVSDPVSATKVPEPSSLSLMGGALALLGAATWFRRKRKAKSGGIAV